METDERDNAGEQRDRSPMNPWLRSAGDRHQGWPGHKHNSTLDHAWRASTRRKYMSGSTLYTATADIASIIIRQPSLPLLRDTERQHVGRLHYLAPQPRIAWDTQAPEPSPEWLKVGRGAHGPLTFERARPINNAGRPRWCATPAVQQHDIRTASEPLGFPDLIVVAIGDELKAPKRPGRVDIAQRRAGRALARLASTVYVQTTCRKKCSVWLALGTDAVTRRRTVAYLRWVPRAAQGADAETVVQDDTWTIGLLHVPTHLCFQSFA